MGGYVPAAVPGGLAELACHPGTSQSLDSRNKRSVWLVSSVTARILAYQETAGPLALRFAPPAPGCHAVNVPLKWQAPGPRSGL